MNKTNPEDAVKELTMVLMYLLRFKEDLGFPQELDSSWKGYSFDTINNLDDEDYIRQGSHRSKSVAITKKGMTLAKELMEKYHINDWA